MEVILSAACSLDGYIDDCSPERLKLSSSEDWAAVDKLRARCDAILVGAETVRKDNPSLTIKDIDVRGKRMWRGLGSDLAKITVTRSGDLDPASRFFKGDGHKIVFAPLSADFDRMALIAQYAEVVRGEEITARFIVEELERRGYKSLMVEGGSRMLTMFLSEGIVDEFRYAHAPFFVGDPNAPKVVTPAVFPFNKDNRMELVSVEMLGDTAVMRFRPKKNE